MVVQSRFPLITYIILVPRDGTMGMRANIILFKKTKYSSRFKIAVKKCVHVSSDKEH